MSATSADLAPPGPISDLSALTATAESVTLSWSAPGNDGEVGQAATYDLRYSTEFIWEALWDAATRVQDVPAPGPVGTAETCTVTGLQAGTTYYFAIRALDEASNLSGLSNMARVIPGEYPLRRLTYSGLTRGATAPAWSPDSRSIVFEAAWKSTYETEIFRIAAGGGAPTKLAGRPGDNQSPSWSPDGARIAWVTDDAQGNPKEIWTMSAVDGSNPTRLAFHVGETLGGCAWSPDGSRIAYHGLTYTPPLSAAEIYTIAASGEDRQQLTSYSAITTGPDWSPDGSRIAFQSTRSGLTEVWIVPAVGGEAIQLTHAGSAAGPSWSPDGGRVVVNSRRSGHSDLWIVPIDGGDWVQLTDDEDADYQAAWSPDGRQIAFASDRGGTAANTDIRVLMLP